jgi:hypothetical protein
MCGFKSKLVALVSGNTIHEWELVTTGTNKSLSDVVKSMFQALARSKFSTLTSSLSNLGYSTFSN